MDRSPAPAPPSCRIERWRGYTSSTFVLRTPAGETFESPSFRWRKSAEPPDEGDARRAYDELLAHLSADGWSVIGHGDAWYAAELTHPTLAAAPTAPAPEREPPAPPPLPLAHVEPPPPAPAVLRRAPAPPPAPATEQAVRPSRRGFVAGLSVGAAAVATIAALLAVAGGHHRTATPTTSAAPTTSPAPTPTTSAAPATAPPAPRARPKPKPAPTPAPTPAAAPKPVVHVAIAAVEIGSWVEVRRGSQHGRVLYAGVLEPGRRLRFEAPRLWARFGAAGHLRITQDGRPVALQGTYDKLFRPR